MRRLLKSKLLLILFLVGAASGFLLSNVGWWGLHHGGRDMEALYQASSTALARVAEVEKNILRSQVLFLDALRKQELSQADREALERGDQDLKLALTELQNDKQYAGQWEEVSHLYARLAASRTSALALLKTDREQVFRFQTGNTQPLFNQMMTALYQFLPQLLARSEQMHQEAVAFNRTARNTLLGLALLTSVFFCITAWFTYRETRARKRQAAQLDHDRTLLRTLFESSNDGVIMLQDGVIVDLNRAAHELFCVPPGSPPEGMTLKQLLPDQDQDSTSSADALQALIDQSLNNGGQHCEWQFMALDGRQFPADLSIDVAHLAEGSVVQMTVHDITKRKENERAMRLSNHAFENSLEGMVITDHNSDILTVNAAFTAITGYARAEVVGRNPHLLNSGRQTREFYDEMWHSLGTRGKWQGEIWNIRKNGEIYPQWLNISRVADELGRTTNYVGVFSDISERKTAEERILRQVYHDQLTGLPNRVLFCDRLAQIIGMAKRRPGQHFGVMFIDLDRFKLINDTLGHDAGDQLLQQTGFRLNNIVREADTVARMAGDEFTIILSEIADPKDAAGVARKILDAFQAPFQLNGKDVYVSLSIGISVYPGDGASAELLLKNADMAMYRAKASGGASFEIYDQNLDQQASQRLAIETELRKAIEREELTVHYQPQFDCRSGKLLGFEALLRWQHPQRGLLLPQAFLTIAEETGLIVPIGAWVLRTACIQAQVWRLQFPGHRLMSVNLSARQFHSPELSDQVAAALRNSGLPDFCLELEINESIVLQNLINSVDIMTTLTDLGVQFSIDHFGLGHCSLAQLNRLPVHALKIDQSFIDDMDTDQHDATIVESIVTMASKQGLRVVAEGIERQSQLTALKPYKGIIGQGYLLGRPLTASGATDLISSTKLSLTSA